ncbi:hypothetical protein GCM10011579_046720 [Streptomyces albiflavescens]|uniref:Sulfatase-modifying factor enzyme-like domain-containing protein n=1 Tax=Streptomyces albiflavescens TaxID=1623582 RepID=A0A917Y6K7_9ACTN|nr:hypothetical protein GCM10011579_046720 [Streptomyces albiflavescens]
MPDTSGRGASCCAPARGEVGSLFQLASVPGPRSDRGSGHDVSAIELPAGEFRMGDAFGEGYPDDAEGPVRTVAVESFRIDATAVTNARVAEFVRATGYRTEAERYGGSPPGPGTRPTSRPGTAVSVVPGTS